jgi:hypothetical protein
VQVEVSSEPSQLRVVLEITGVNWAGIRIRTLHGQLDYHQQDSKEDRLSSIGIKSNPPPARKTSEP